MSSIFDILYVPMGWLIRVAYSLTSNYFLSILLFALVMEIILSPLQIKQQKTQIKQAKMQPMINVITKKYEGRSDKVSMQKKQQEIMEVYQKEGFNPAGGCLPLLIQLPIILCLYRVIITPLTYITRLGQDAVTKLQEIAKLAGVEKYTDQATLVNFIRDNIDNNSEIKSIVGDSVIPNYKFLGMDLSQQPSFNEFNWLWIVPLLVFLAMWGSMIIMKKFTYQSPETADAQNKTSMKIMNFAMPLMSAFISFSVPLAVAFYWIFRNILATVEKYIFSKIFPIPKPTPEEMKAAEREYLGKKVKKEKDPNRAPVKSLHRIDFDDEEPLPDLKPGRYDRDDSDIEVTETRTAVLNGEPIKAPEGDSRIEKAPLKDDKKDN